MRKNNNFFTTIEKILFFLLLFLLSWGVGGLFFIFYEESVVYTPSKGGVYKEGMIGDVSNIVLNPVFVYGKRDRSIESDISSLLFVGLMKFDSKEGKIKDFLATHTLSTNKKTYTFRLKDGIRWHDGANLTVDDVLFTFKDVIQHKDFSNEHLKRAFKDVEIKKISDNEVSFTISYPYKFFLTNFTVGILPKHLLKNIPVSEMEYNDFSNNPIGNGPFKFSGVNEIRRNVFKILLENFKDSSLFSPYLDSIEFIVYSSKNSLLLDSKNLLAIRPFPKAYSNDFLIEGDFNVKNFSLPQYSALFFNMKNEIFKGVEGRKIRLGIQLAINKNEISKIGEGVRIDTPLLETNKEEWLYNFDLDKARGSLKDAGYFLPSKKPKNFIPKNSQELFIKVPSLDNTWEGKKSDYLDKDFLIGGSFPLKTKFFKVFLDNEEVKKVSKPKLSRAWNVELPFTDSFQEDTHELRVKFYDFDDKYIAEDSISIYLEPEKLGNIKDNFEIRENKNNERLTLNLLTAKNPYYYTEIANYIKEDLKRIGIDLKIKSLDMQAFLDSVRNRNYDILLYGQNLGYNLDIYEFFHESQIGKDNLSDYQNSKASILIEEIRSSHIQEIRNKKLQELRNLLKKDIPAVFLFSPKYLYNYNSSVKNMNLNFIGLHKDRFSNIYNVYIKSDKQFKENTSFFDYPMWFINNFISFISFSL
jgi:ABC-type transport system substrate-binding protein